MNLFEKKYQNKNGNCNYYTPSQSLLKLYGRAKSDFGPFFNILELGAGLGTFFQKEDGEVHLLELSPSACEGLRENVPADFKIIEGNICDYPLKNEEYNLVMDSHCLHHVCSKEDRGCALNNIYQSLKPGGVFVFEHALFHSSLAIPYGEYGARSSVWKVSDEPYKYIPHSIKIEEEIKSCGFEIVYLMAYSHVKIILDASRTEALPTDADLLQVIAKKKESE